MLHWKMAVGQGLAGVLQNPEQGTVLQELTSVNLRIAGKDRSASTGTDRSIAGAFHRDASCWRAGQRQDHIAAQYCPGARPAAEDPFGH